MQVDLSRKTELTQVQRKRATPLRRVQRPAYHAPRKRSFLGRIRHETQRYADLKFN